MPFEKIGVVYLRLSKEDGDVTAGTMEESCSIGSQRACIHRFLKKEGVSPDSFDEIVDDGYSGTNMNRPGMKRLLEMVEDGKVGTIVVRDLSRFARNYLEAGHYLEFVFPVYNVRFISVNDNFDSKALGETTGGLDLAIKNLINQMYSKDISRKIKSAVDLKKLNGEYVYGTAPYGYKKGEKKNTIVVDEPAAAVVRQIFSWAAAGITITQIAKRLNESGIITPSVYLAAVRGKYKTQPVWNFESVRNILANRIYTGDTVPFKSHVVRVGSDLVKQIPEELQQVIPDTHEGIISREMFYQARMVIKTNHKSKPTAPPNPFTSLLVCGVCGKRLMKGKPQNKNWMCATHRYVPDSECQNVRISEEVLTRIVLRAITTQCQLLDEKIKQVKKQSHQAKSNIQILETECVTLRRQIEKADSDKMSLYENYVSGVISKDSFIIKKQAASEQEQSLKIKLRIAEDKLNTLRSRTTTCENQVSVSEWIIQYQNLDTLTPELTHELIKKIVIGADGYVRIEWNFRDETAELIDLDWSTEKAEAV